MLHSASNTRQTIRTINPPEVWDMKSAKRDKEGAAHSTASTQHLLFGQLPPNVKFTLARDANKTLGVLTKGYARGYHKFCGNATMATGGIVHVGSDVEVEPVQ